MRSGGSLTSERVASRATICVASDGRLTVVHGSRVAVTGWLPRRKAAETWAGDDVAYRKRGAMKRYAIIAATVTLPVVVVAIAVVLWGANGASSAGPVPRAEDSGVSASEHALPPTATTATAASPSQSPSESTSATPSSVLEDGRHFGYIESIDLETLPGTAVFDLAYFLIGEEANQAAAEDGYSTPVDNDYYIVNENPRLRTLVVSPDVTIRLVDWGHSTGLFSADPRRFQQSFDLDDYPLGTYKGRFAPYRLTMNDGVVVTIEEQYLP
jgi:hypothetical protein